jgi:hypothetical protein
MPQNVFLPVPDWFSWENEGAGVAVADLAGRQHLVVLAVDAPAGQNRGVYRLGHDLTGDGVTGDWTPWRDVPDWFSWSNQGADVAVADLGGPALVVLMVDDPVERNQGLYRIGHGLAADGTVTGWTPWLEVPDWFPWRNAGAGVAVTPPDANGVRDLVVFMIDDADEVNRGLYRLGRDLQPDGTVRGGWTPWTDVPGWFSWFNQGGGIAVADLDGHGGRDLVVFQVDDAVPTAEAGGRNEGFFRVGRHAGPDGAVAPGDWGADWLGVPHWFSWTNQFGAVAVADIGGVTRLVALMADAPDGPNSGWYQLVDLDEDPAVYGRWEVKSFFSQVLPVHAALLHTGDPLFFAGSGSSETRFRAPEFGDVAKGVAVSTVWHPPGDTFTEPATLRAADGRPFDLFCGGDAFLADGTLLSAGGTRSYGGFTGRDDVAVFDPATGTWSFTTSMAHSRWYPTLLTLGDGRVLAASGLDEHGGDTSKSVLEFFDPGPRKWVHAPIQGGAQLPLYAHLFPLADGRVFFSGGRMDDAPLMGPHLLDPTTDPVATVPVDGVRELELRNQSASVLLAPAQDQRVLIAGGGPEGKPDKTHATAEVDVVDLRAADPRYAATGPMCLGRMHLNTVLLPDRTVFVSGGSLKQESEPLARLQAEAFDPATGEWTLRATATVPRLYHSTALLLPDARVVAAGGNPEGGHSVPWLPPDPDEEMRLEVFSPPYLFRGPRPVVTAAPTEAGPGDVLTVVTSQAAEIRWVSLVRAGVTTHSFDSGQRLVDAPIVGRQPDRLTATVPANPDLAPPGWYMLFLVDRDGVPSEATWLHLTRP